ncbi:MAG: response regulator [Verrucomicrobia bacterium]|nr:response regulator [Verrucomicrobiota bacterium]
MKILIAEDDSVARSILTGALRKHQHDFVVTLNGRQAWDAFRKDYFPVVISDWIMPEMDGLELSRAIRSMLRTNYTYIIILTSMSGKANYLEAMEAGADDFINKPFDEEHLVARLHVAARILGLRKHVKQLEGLLPICAYCKRIRDEDSVWQPIERYIASRSEAKFTHTICPDCYLHVVKPQIQNA